MLTIGKHRSIGVHNLPFPKINGDIVKFQLTEKLWLEQWWIPSGTTIGLKQTINFGFIILPEGCKDVRGFEIPRRLFKC